MEHKCMKSIKQIWQYRNSFYTCSQQWWFINVKYTRMYSVQCICDCLPVSVSTETASSDDQLFYNCSNIYTYIYICGWYSFIFTIDILIVSDLDLCNSLFVILWKIWTIPSKHQVGIEPTEIMSPSNNCHLHSYSDIFESHLSS